MQPPPGFVNSFDGPEKLPVLDRAVLESLSDALPGTQQFDLREWLKTNLGVAFPSGALAVYDKAAGHVVCIAPAKVIEAIAPLGLVGCYGPRMEVQLGATLVSFECSSSAKIENLPYERLRSLAGSSWREVEHFMVTAKNGNRVVAERRAGDVAQKSASSSELEKAEPGAEVRARGATIEIEPTIAPDGREIDVNYVFRRWTGEGASADWLETTSSATLTDGIPQIVAFWPLNAPGPALVPGQPLCLLGLMLQVDLINAEGVPVRKVFADQVRQIREKMKASKGEAKVPATEP